MPIIFISNSRTLSDNAKPLFPGMSGIGVVEITLKARTNGFTILSNIDESDGFRVEEGASYDLISKTEYDSYNLNEVYWKNTTAGNDCIVEIIGKRRV